MRILEVTKIFNKPVAVFVLATLGGFFLSQPVSAASDISVSNSGKVSFGKVSASSTGTLATGQDTLSIATDCEAGANVYATSVNGSSTGTSLINLAAKEQDESSNGGTGVNPASYTITTSSNSISSPGSLENNTWGLNVINNNTYYGLPEYSASGLPTVIYSGTNTELPIYYGAKVTNSLAPGTYTGEVLYTVTVNNSCLDYTVKFNKNANDASGDMSDQSILPTGGALSENSFTYSGYAFLGWSLDPAGKTGTAENGIGTAEDVDFADKASFPGSNESILPGSETTLYAIWEKQIIYMQNWFGCAKMQQNEIVTLTDSRDNHEYKVKKLPDGKCWMINNLTLTATDLITEGKALTNTNTNIPNDDNNSYYIPPKNTRYATANSITNSNVATASSGVNFDTNYSNHPQIGYRDVGDTNNSDNIAQPEDTAYYPFYTATLGFSYYNDGKKSGSSPRDICPKGWRLPWTNDYGTANGNNYSYNGAAEIYQLALTYNDNSNVWSNYIATTSTSSNTPTTNDATIRQNMINGDVYSLDPESESNGAAGFTNVGFYNGLFLYYVGTYGFYWSSSIYSGVASYDFRFETSEVRPQHDSNKFNGYAVRCVDQYSNVTGYMQDFNDNTELPNETDSTYLIDKRDGKEYAVKRLPDGKVWMMQNLTIGSNGAKTLTPNDTNIDDGKTYYLPPAGKQSSSAIDNPDTTTVAPNTANFNSSNDNYPKTQFGTKNSSVTNDSDTGYYNFYTATLGYSYYGDNVTSGSSPRDICPKGWRLPRATDKGTYVTTVGSTNDFTYLAQRYNTGASWDGGGATSSYYYSYDSTIRNSMYMYGAYPLAASSQNNYAGFSYSGYYNNTVLNGLNTYGYYLINSVADGYNNYYASFQSSTISPQSTIYKYYGLATRCIARSSYTINYDANGGIGEMAPSKGYRSENTVLSKNTFTKDNHYFLGWSTDPSATSPTYADGAAITDLASAGGSITLYAIWVSISGTMQDASCSDLTIGDTSALMDSRDSQVYSIYRWPSSGAAGVDYPTGMAGYCMMTRDLSLGFVTNGSITKGTNLVLSTGESAGSGTIVAHNIADAWQETENYSQYADYNNNTYYSYDAAQRVCPKGWRVPSKGHYDNIISFLGGDSTDSLNKIQDYPYTFKQNGYFSRYGLNYQSSGGEYWSSSTYNSYYGYYLNFNEYHIQTNYSNGHTPSGLSGGRSVRCIKNP